ncbi:hypothetical protein BS78_06G107600 [Paspalum vaginatum]|nr:hypothetical protein BS78_06G107600 [Paspalum vaginatum]
MATSLPEDVDAGGSGPPVAWWSAASPVGGDVVLSGVALLFVAVAFAFVLYHYFPRVNRGGGTAGVRLPSSSAQQRGASGGLFDAAAGGGRGRGGLDPDELRALPVTPYRAKDQASDSELEALECAVCLAELADGEAARFLPRCGHGFHAECVDLWLRRHPTCPLCRVDVAAPAPSFLALPPALPEPANYPTNLPTNVLFWGSHDAFTAARTAGPAPSAIGEASAALVIEVREPPAPGLARLSSLRRLWNRGRHDAAAASSHSCRRATAAAGAGTERASATSLHTYTSYIEP